MILEVPDIKKGKKLVFEIIRNNKIKINSPGFYAYNKNIISVFEKKDIEKRNPDVVNEVAALRYIYSLPKKESPENFIVFMVTQDNYFKLIIKKDSEVLNITEFKADIQDLLRIYENYKDIDCFYVPSEKMESLLENLWSIYSNDEEFHKIEAKLTDEDFKNFQYNDSIAAYFKETKASINKLFEKKEKTEKRKDQKEKIDIKSFFENIDKHVVFWGIGVLIMLSAVYGGYTYYDYYTKKKIQEERTKVQEELRLKREMEAKNNFKKINLNQNKRALIEKIILDGNFISFEIDDYSILGLFDLGFNIDEKIESETLIGSKIGLKYEIPKKTYIKEHYKIAKSNLKDVVEYYFKDKYTKNSSTYTVGAIVNKENFLNFIKEVSFSNNIEYSGHISLKKDGKLSVFLLLRG